MPIPPIRLTPILLVATIGLGGAGLSGCATEKYVQEQIALVNTRVDGVDAKATDAGRRADAAMASAQTANTAAQAANNAAQAAARSAQTATADAARANQRLDQLGPRVDTIEQQQRAMATTPKRPRN